MKLISRHKNVFWQHLVALFVFTLILSSMPRLSLAQSVNPAFTPSKLIEDKVFSDTQTFGSAEGIQQFLQTKNSVLANTSPDFLVRLKEPPFADLKVQLEDPQPNLGRLRTAAELIWDASRQSGINPQVLLVTLQKEQSLITGHQESSPQKLQRALDNAMGFDCPDATGCGLLFPGFYFQIFGNVDTQNNRYLGAARSLMKSFSTPGGRGPLIGGRTAKIGETVTLTNTTGAPYNAVPEQAVLLENAATAALYRYTPHVFNGNYNFWRYFNEWFRYPNGSILQLAGNPTLYYIENGSVHMLPAFVAAARGLNLSSALTVSPTEYESIPKGGTLGPADNTVVQITGETQKFVFIANEKRPVSDLVLKQRNLHNSPVLTITAAEAQLFGQGQVLPPSDGTVVRGVTQPQVYRVEGGVLKLFSAYTFKQLGITAKQISLVPDQELSTYPKQGFVAPKTGTLVKAQGSGTVYEISEGLKLPMSYAVYLSRKLTPSRIVTLSDEEVAGIATGGYARPAEKTFFEVGKNGPVYYFKEGGKKPILALVKKQQGITPDFTVSQDEANSWADGIPVAPRNNTIVKGAGSDAVYLVVAGQLRPMTYEAFKRRKITAKQIVVIPEDELAQYAKGDTLAK